MSINAIPAEILLEIAGHLAHLAEVLHLYLTVCNHYIITRPHLLNVFSPLVIENCGRPRPSSVRAHHTPWSSPMRPHARHALRSTRPRAARPLSRAQPRLFGWAGVQVGSQCASRRIPGVRCGAACGEESRGLAHLCVGWRGVTPLRRHVVRAPYLVCPIRFSSPRRNSRYFSCPRLKSISTSLGSILPPPNSHVRGRTSRVRYT